MYITGLIGKNISYSKSPQIHNDYYKKNNIPFSYKIFNLKPDQIDNFIKNLYKNNIRGFNATIPYKEIILQYLNDIVYPADKIGAVNTVVVQKNKLVGYNTDYIGFVKSLQYYNIQVKNLSCLIIGSGGSAKCIYYALKELGAKKICIISRNPEKAKLKFEKKVKILNSKDENKIDSYDLIVNCTPIGGPNFKEEKPIELKGLKKKCVVYDLNYIPRRSKLLKEAKEKGAFIINGEKMLDFQAYSAIDLWCLNGIEGGQ
ncbi:shikimate dehydrogenase [Clostridium sporogenes]|uniref:shikimate dehydrogenase n=1 Tax=Clostridium sporogenes TaxID=1509 RepID=UPI0013D1F6D7|nr:shikimate dehydrogenase [Clostridium sporogenes]NFV14174.1 shikimate dehydrogenase [Clostridium sporogenes]